MITDYIMLALKNLRKRKLRTWLTLLGIFIGIAAVVALISLGAGLQTAVTGQFSSLGTDRLVVQSAQTSFAPPGSNVITKLTEHDVDIIKQVNGAEEVIPRLLRVVTLEYNDIVNYGYAVSVPEDKKHVAMMYESMALETESGKLLYEGDEKKVLIGHDFVKNNIFEKELIVGKKIKIQGKDFVIQGILKPAGTFQVNSALFIKETDIKEILSIEDEWDIITVKIQDGYDIEKVAEAIKERLRKDRDEKEGEEDFSVQTPSQAISGVNNILNIINLIIIGIASISLLVGAIGIANTMYTSVLERRKEIGVMKAIGAKNSDILYIFLFESGFLGLIGGIIGAVLGISLALGMSSGVNAALETQLITVKISWPLLLSAVGFSFIIGMISGTLPAIQASKLKPVDALRG